MIKVSALLFGIVLGFNIMAKTPDLNQMTEEEKNLTGINKLTDDELNALSQWLRNEQLKINRKIREQQAGFEQRRNGAQRKSIRARLVKSYKDKLGHAFYELDNGQIWKNTSGQTIFLKKDGRQIVTIEPAMFSSWEIRGDGNRSVKVKRIK